MALFKKYDLVHEYGKETYCLLNDPEVKRIGNYDYYKAKAVEILFTYDSISNSVPVYVIEWKMKIHDVDVLYAEFNKATYNNEHIHISELANIEHLKERYRILSLFREKITKLIQNYGTVSYDNECYIPTGEASAEVCTWGYPVYFAEVIAFPLEFFDDDYPNENGLVRTHDLQLVLRDGYYEKWKNKGDKVLDRKGIWDWNNPHDIVFNTGLVEVKDLAD